MKTIIALIIFSFLLSFVAFSGAEEISMTGRVTEIEKYGHAVLDIAVGDYINAGFALGDIVTVKAGTYEGDMPCLNGYYVDRGECMIRAYPGSDTIAVCINYGKFAEAAGIGVGDPVTLTLRKKAGALMLQEINNLVYTDNREDYASDEIFANFRAVVPGKLYRSASPVESRHNRAETADRLIRQAEIRTVMNLAEHDPPFLVHCTEGKDRAGFACMVLGMLAGFSAEDIISDYMISYSNYYGILEGTEKYEMIAEKNIQEMMLSVAGAETGNGLEGIDWKAAGERYLISHGMSADTIAMLEAKLK